MNYTREYLLGAPKVLRTHCYVQPPARYDIFCPVCGKANTTWSEFEKHIWCYDCKEDVYVPLNESGIFSGPIPWELTHMLGTNFGRINLKTQEILKDDGIFPDKEYNATFVSDKTLNEYENDERSHKIEDAHG